VLGVHLLDTVVHSNHDIVGDLAHKDSNLIHMVTDGDLRMVVGGSCVNPQTVPTVAVQANGVIRESLRFGTAAHGGMTTVADIFGVLPLGASPWADASVQAPGYPMVMFYLLPVELFAGIDVGVTKGLESDSFFISYSGMRVSYDPTGPAFDKATFNPMGTEAYSRITKIELGTDATGYMTIYEYNKNDAIPVPWAARWTGINPGTGKIRVITNLYLAGFLDAFGLSPRDANLQQIKLPQAVLCQTMNPAPSCTASPAAPAIDYCMALDTAGAAQNPPVWHYPEVKEWGLLLKYLTNPAQLGGLASNIPDDLYYGNEPASPRVIPVQP
jgi:hypothetical protein